MPSAHSTAEERARARETRAAARATLTRVDATTLSSPAFVRDAPMSSSAISYDAMVCSADDMMSVPPSGPLASTVPPSAVSMPPTGAAPPAPTPRPPPRRSAAPGATDDAATPAADGSTPVGAPADGGAAPAVPGAPGTAPAGHGARGGGAGGAGGAGGRGRRGAGREEEPRPEPPFVPLPIPQAANDPVQLSRQPLERTPSMPPLVMPRALTVVPDGGTRDVSPMLRRYDLAFSNAADSALRIYDEVVTAGRAEHERLRSLYTDLQADAQRQLDESLDKLRDTLAEARGGLEQAEADAIFRLGLQAENARAMIRVAARRAQGTIAARKAAIQARMTDAQAAVLDVENQLAGYLDAVNNSGAAASAAFTALQTDPSRAHAPHAPADYTDHSPKMQAAENEDIDVAVPVRAGNRATAFTDGASVFADNLNTAHTNFQNAATAGFRPFQNYIDRLSQAPAQIARMRDSAIKQVDHSERSSADGVRRSRNSIEIGLIDRHRRSREQLVAQSTRAAESQRQGMTRAGESQWKGFTALAGGQGAAILALHESIAAQRAQPPDNFARFVIQGGERTRDRQREAADARLGQSAGAAERMRRQFEIRGAQTRAAGERGAGQLDSQLSGAAHGSGLQMMAQILALDQSLRRMADPVAASIDNFPIPARAELDAMENDLWSALRDAQAAAVAAYMGSPSPASPPDPAMCSTPPSGHSPPAGTGSSPKEFVDLSDDYTAAPESETETVGLIRTVAQTVVSDVTNRGDGLIRQMSLLGQNPEQTLNLVRGLTYLRGQAVIKYYDDVKPGSLWDDVALYMSFGNLLTGVHTRIYSGNAVYNYLLGNRAAGALNEIQAATEWTNNADQVQAAMTALSPADMAELRRLDPNGTVLDSVENDLEGADRRMFQLLRSADETNAVDRVAAARAVRVEAAVGHALDESSDRGGDNAFDAMERFAQQAGTSRLEGATDWRQTATGELESPEAAEERRRASWQNTVSRLGNDGERRADGAAGGVAWLTEMAGRERVYAAGDTYYTSRLRQEQIDLLGALARTGAGSPETRAMQLAVEDSRPGGADRERVERARDDPDLNPDMGNPDDPNARMSRPHDPVADPTRLERAQQREAEMYRIWDRYRNGGRDSGRTIEAIRADLGGRLRRGASDEREGRLMEMQITRGLTDPRVAALAFEHAVDRWGTDEALLRSTFRRMSRDQIQEAVAEYDRTHSPGLYERLGLFEHSDDWFTELSGDDRIEMQVLAMGQPRNPRERAEVARMTSRLQMENSSWIGRHLAGDEYRRLEASHNRLLRMMGVSEGDETHASDFDSHGFLRARGPGGNPIRVGNFDERGNFVPVTGDDRSVIAFTALMATNESNAQAYREATDNIANAITTALVVAAAILSTAFTGGGAASFWIPVLSTFGAGVLGMAASWAIKGGRYGYEDAGRDFGLAVVQAATAGLASGLNIARAGGMGALRTALTSRLISTAGFRTVTLAEEIAIGGAAGAFGGAGNAAFDDRAWDRGEWLANIGRGAERGFTGGMMSSLATGLTTRAVSLGATGLGRLAGGAEALARGRGTDVAARLGSLRGRAWGESFGSNLIGRTLGGGVGNAASRWAEIQYDRSHGRYEGSSAQAADEIWSAGAQGAMQSYGEGIAEHAVGGGPLRRQQEWEARRMAAGEPATHPPSRAPPTDEHGATARPRGPPAEEREVAPGRRRGVAPHEDELAVRTADDDGRAPRRPQAANDNPLVATHVRVDLGTVDPNVIGRIAEGTVIVHPDPTSYAGAEANFRRLLAADPTREAAIFHNPDTGEWVVIQGGPKAVTAIRPDGEMTGVGAQGRMVAQGGLVRGQRPWLLHEHFHPNRPGEAGTRLSRRMPSAIGGDFSVVLMESGLMGFGARSSRIHFDDNGTPSYTDFGVAPGHPKGPLWVNYPDPVTGARVTEHFASIGDYHRAMVRLLGDELRAAAGGTAVRTGDHDAPDPAGPRRALARGSEETSLTDVDRPVIQALGDQLALNDQQRMHLATLSAAGSTEPEIARARSVLDATQEQARRMVRDLGLVGEPDSMARLHLLINDLGPSGRPGLPDPIRQLLLETVVAATREHMIAMGTLDPGEPLMLLLHGAPGVTPGSGATARGDLIRAHGIQLDRITGGASDDFGRGFYTTTGVRPGEVYANKPSRAHPNPPRGEVFPFMLRGRDFGPTVDVSPGGAHRALWERYVMEHFSEFGDPRIMPGAPPPDFRSRGPMAFGTLDASANRGVVFEGFLQHLAAQTGRPELARPDLVLGELGGPFTTGFGHGDQQAIRSQRIMDLMNAQLGFRSTGGAVEPETGGTAVRTADDVAAMRAAARTADLEERARIREMVTDADVEASFARSFDQSAIEETPAQTTARQQADAAAMDMAINAAVARFVSGGGPDGALLGELLRLAPESTDAALRNFGAGRGRDALPDRLALDLSLELRGRGVSPDQVEALRTGLTRLLEAGGPLHTMVAREAEGASWRRFSEGMQARADAALDRRLDTLAARQFAEREGRGSLGPRMKQILRADEGAAIDFLTGSGTIHERLRRYIDLRRARGATSAEARADAGALMRIERDQGMIDTRARWRRRLADAAITEDDLATMVRQRPDELLHLAYTSPEQFAEVRARMLADLIPDSEAGNRAITAAELAGRVRRSQDSAAKPILSELSAVRSLAETLGLQVLKADSLMRGRSNQGGIDIVGFTPRPGHTVDDWGNVRVHLIDDKAISAPTLEDVSALTGERLWINLYNSANEIETRVRALEATPAAQQRDVREFILGARKAIEQMRTAGDALRAITPRSDSPGYDTHIRSDAHAAAVARILWNNDIVLIVTREYGNVEQLATWLRRNGFYFDDEYRRRVARELLRLGVAR